MNILNLIIYASNSVEDSGYIAFYVFGLIGLLFLVAAIILRGLKLRFWASLSELLCYASILVFSCQYVTLFSELGNDFTWTKLFKVLFFVFILVLFIYKLVVFIRKKAL